MAGITPSATSTVPITPPTAALVNDKRSRAAAKDLAVKAMKRFARPDMPAEDWWGELEPLLSAQARSDYLGVDPSLVPVRAITGKASLVDLDTNMLVIAHIPTDQGLYAVTVSRSPEDPAWRVESIVPPEQDPHPEGG